jgi:hypothetical protein
MAKHYNYFRDYHPSLGRYLQSDPLGLADGADTFSYVGGDPISYVDPEGGIRFKFPKPQPKPGTRPPPQDKDRAIREPDRKPGSWSCNAAADCNDNQPGNCPEDPWKRFAFGGGSSNNLGDARNIAKSNAVHNLGCQAKHVRCICVGPKGERYQGGC